MWKSILNSNDSVNIFLHNDIRTVLLIPYDECSFALLKLSAVFKTGMDGYWDMCHEYSLFSGLFYWIPKLIVLGIFWIKGFSFTFLFSHYSIDVKEFFCDFIKISVLYLQTEGITINATSNCLWGFFVSRLAYFVAVVDPFSFSVGHILRHLFKIPLETKFTAWFL